MKRKKGFLIALASAAATFGILFITVGKPHMPCHHACHYGHHHNMHHSPHH